MQTLIDIDLTAVETKELMVSFGVRSGGSNNFILTILTLEGQGIEILIRADQAKQIFDLLSRHNWEAEEKQRFLDAWNIPGAEGYDKI